MRTLPQKANSINHQQSQQFRFLRIERRRDAQKIILNFSNKSYDPIIIFNIFSVYTIYIPTRRAD